ncbi:hypothetical protein [uncultured Abiotrophia sp.]|uniref:hypothetical protein n=1 Tax=uncultured Abiotrophia sp. TaxID=316094 RepID=UPI0028EF8C37|nr:hypothetical protein [uncultured Abiotrophia sp.]
MKLSLKKCVLALILANQLLVVPQAFSQISAQERQDLSPVTQFGSEQSSQPTSKSSNSSESSSQQEDPNKDLTEIKLDQPETILTALYHDQARVVMNVALIDGRDNGQPKGKTLVTINSGDMRYLHQTDSHALPFTAMMKLSEGKVTAAWQAVEDLMGFAKQVANSQAEAVKDTALDKLAHLDESKTTALKDKFVALDSTEQAQTSYQISQDWQAFYQAVLTEWLASQPQPSKKDGQVLSYELSDEAGKQWTAIMKKHQADFPRLKDTFDLFSDDYDGTITLDYANKKITVGLIQGKLALEYHLDLKATHLTEPTGEAVLSQEQFNEVLGADWFQGLIQLEKLIN